MNNFSKRNSKWISDWKFFINRHSIARIESHFPRSLLKSSFVLSVLVLLVASNSSGVGNFCPRLEGMDLKCDQISPTGVPAPPGCGGPSDDCYKCELSTYKTMYVSSYCPSWSCEIIPVPEGTPERRAKCAATPVTCCRQSELKCCKTPPVTKKGIATLLDEATCKYSVDCGDPTFKLGYPPEMCRQDQLCGDLPPCITVPKLADCPI